MLSNQFFLLVFLVLFSFHLSAQDQEICGSTVQAHNQMMEDNGDYKKRVELWRKQIQPIVKARSENKNPDCSNGPLLVPIAIHFNTGIVPTGQEACAVDVAIDHIEELNREFAGLDIDAPLINQFASCFGADILGNACVEFCIGVANHPAGYGLVDGDYAITFGQVSFSIPTGNFTPVNADWNEYVNIYVNMLSGGLLGISNGIPGMFNGDGVMIDNCIFGTGDLSCPGAQFTGSPGCFPTADAGEVLAHELGHYFGLFHVWGDNSGCSGAQDQIADTPDMSTNYSSYTSCTNHTTCTDLPQTCGDEDMYMNFMSYAANSCMYMFTSDQSDVMNATAVTEGYTTTSTKCGQPPVANFSPDGNIELCQTDCIDFFDLSSNMPTSWDWTFEVISGDLVLDILTSDLQNPTICITAGANGEVSVTLTATNNTGSDQITKTLSVFYGVIRTTYADLDNDSYGDPNNVTVDCIIPPGNVSNNLDCDDSDININPAASEVCDGIDNNCDGAIDEGLTPVTYYADTDNDTYGDPNSTIIDCTPPIGYVTDNQDCDDTNPNINPAAIEVCDNIDNNCDGLVDEGLMFNTYYADTDNDTYGDPNNTISSCSLPSGYVTDDQDCDDTNTSVNPGASESCDGIDNNCDNVIDEGCALEDCDGDYLIINNITQNSYRAEINATSDALLNNGQSILFTAGSDIDLSPNFEVASGTIFEASITPCEPITLIDNDDIVSLNLSTTDVLSPEILKTFTQDESLTIRLRDKSGNDIYSNKIVRSDIIDEIKKAALNLEKGFYMISVKSKSALMAQRVVIIQ